MTSRTEHAARWMYSGIWSILVQWFKVPSEPPSLPVRTGEYIQRFQPDAGFLRYLKFYFWFVLIITDFALFIGWLALGLAAWWLVLVTAPLAWFLIIAPDVVAFIAIHLRYDSTWYVMTDRSLRIRRGIWIIHEVTITFENVQNILVRQGPVQRHFGIANVIVQTAGGGGGGEAGKGAQMIGHEGVIEGIANAHEIRDRILSRLRETKSAGLGDEGSNAVHDVGWTTEHRAILRTIREHVQAINQLK